VLVDWHLAAALTALTSVRCDSCDLPRQCTLASMPQRLCELDLTGCTHITSLDVSTLAGLTSLIVIRLPTLQRVAALPAALMQLACEDLPALTQLALGAAPNVRARITRCMRSADVVVAL
jgi:hypothetical protein